MLPSTFINDRMAVKEGYIYIYINKLQERLTLENNGAIHRIIHSIELIEHRRFFIRNLHCDQTDIALA